MCVLRLPWRMHAGMGLVPAFSRDLITGTWKFLICRHARISIGSSLEISLFMLEYLYSCMIIPACVALQSWRILLYILHLFFVLKFSLNTYSVKVKFLSCLHKLSSNSLQDSSASLVRFLLVSLRCAAFRRVSSLPSLATPFPVVSTLRSSPAGSVPSRVSNIVFKLQSDVWHSPSFLHR
jgi:hypothetical protein